MYPQHASHIKYNEFNAIKSYVQGLYVPHNSQLSLSKRFEKTHTNKTKRGKKRKRRCTCSIWLSEKANKSSGNVRKTSASTFHCAGVCALYILLFCQCHCSDAITFFLSIVARLNRTFMSSTTEYGKKTQHKTKSDSQTKHKEITNVSVFKKIRTFQLNAQCACDFSI